MRVELIRRDVSYRDLAELLQGIGVRETDRSIANKVARGTFSFAFFLQVMKALDCNDVHFSISDIRIDTNGRGDAGADSADRDIKGSGQAG